MAITRYLPVSCSLTISSVTPHSTRNIVSENLSNNPVDGWMLKFTLAFLEPGLSIAWLMIQRYGYLIRLFERTKKKKRKKNNNEKRDLWYFISNKLIIDTFYIAHFLLTRMCLSVVKLHNSFFNNIFFIIFFFYILPRRSKNDVIKKSEMLTIKPAHVQSMI